MKKFLIKSAFFLNITLILLILLSGCASTNQTKINLEVNSLEEEPYYIKNSQTFTQFTLKNGIPVCIKKVPSARTTSLRIVFLAQPLKSPETSGGIAEVCFLQMLYGNSKYSQDEIYTFEYTQQTDFYYKLHRDYYEYGVTTTKDRILKMADVLSSTMLNPRMETKDFLEVYDDCRRFHNNSILTSRMQVLSKINKDLFVKDKYFMPLNYTAETKFSASDVKNFQQNLLNASRIKILATGNFSDKDIEDLKKKITDDYSVLKAKGYTKLDPALTQEQYSKALESLNKENIISRSQEQKNCALGIYPVPAFDSPDYEAYAVLSLMADDVLYSGLKDHSQSVSSCGTGLFTGLLNTGVISLTDVSETRAVVTKAQNLLKGTLTAEYIQSKLDYYKNVCIGLLSSQDAVSQAVCDKMTVSQVYFNDPAKYIERSFKVRKLTAQQVIDVYNRTIGKNIVWYMTE